MIDSQTANCPKCDAKLDEFPGVGPFCPNPDCDVVDDIWGHTMPTIDKPGATERYTLDVQRTPSGLWLVMGSMHKGLLVCGRTMSEALSRVEGAWEQLNQVDADRDVR
jgi:hypothetical protein